MRDTDGLAWCITIPTPAVVLCVGWIGKSGIGVGCENPIGFGSCQLDGTAGGNIAEGILPSGDAAIIGVAKSDLVRGGGVLARQEWASRATPDVGCLGGIGLQDQADGFEGI